jgi:hypothetical protein
MGLGSLLRKARNVGPSVTLPGIGKVAIADVMTGGMTKQASVAQPYVEDLVRDVPVAGDIVGVDSSAEIAQQQQQEALGQAQAQREKSFDEAQKYLSPYRTMGESVLFGADGSGGMLDRVKGGDFVQGDFSYTGSQPKFSYGGTRPSEFSYGGQGLASKVGYGGQQPDQFSYGGQGQQGQLNYTGQQGSDTGYTGSQSYDTGYTGGPVDRSIESYMKDDPSLAWQQEQMEKMLERRAAAKGGFGGGAIEREMLRETAGLLSQDYGNRFNRAQQERMADVSGERDQYGRSLTDLNLRNIAERSDYDRAGTALDRANLAEQSQYGRASTAFDRANLAEQSQYDRAANQYGMDVSREQDAYGRALTDTNMGNLASQDAYNRAQYGYQTGVDREQDAYNRATQQHGFNVTQEQQDYNRALSQYGIEGQNLANEYGQLSKLASFGPQMAQAMANAQLGHGSSLSDLAIQGGNVNASATMANANQLGKLMELGGSAAQLYAAGV